MVIPVEYTEFSMKIESLRATDYMGIFGFYGIYPGHLNEAHR